MRFSTKLNTAIKVARKGKDNKQNIKEIVEVIKGAVVSYKGAKGAKGALKLNRKVKVPTMHGAQTLSKLDEESLLVIIKQRHQAAVADVCQEEDDNCSLNAELQRAMALDPVLLGATFWLDNPDTEATKLL